MSWTDLRFEPFRLIRRYESALNPNLRQGLRVFSPTGIQFKRNDVHPRKFLPLVEMLKAKHSSLWSSLSFSKQEELLTLLEQMKPEEQDSLLKVVKKMSPFLCVYYASTDHIDELLSLLTRLQSTDRSRLLRRLEPMNLLELRKLIRVMDSLEESKQVELLGILDDFIALEQKILLNVMSNTTYKGLKTVLNLMKCLLPVDRSRLLRVLDGLDSTSQCGLLRVLEHSSQHYELIDQSNLLRLLEAIEQKKLISVMDSLEESERVKLFGILNKLEAPEQKILLNIMLNSSYSLRSDRHMLLLTSHFTRAETVLKLMNSLLPVDRSRLLRVLDGLDIANQHSLLEMLERSSRRHELVETMDQLKPEEKLRLLRMQHAVDSPVTLSKMIDEILDTPKRISEIIDGVELQQLDRLGHLQQHQFPILAQVTVGVSGIMRHSLHNVHDLNSDDVRLLSKAAVLRNLLELEGCRSLSQYSLQCLNELDPLERKQLPRVLRRLNFWGQPKQVEILSTKVLKDVDVLSMLARAYELLMQMEYDNRLQRLLQLFVCLLSIYLSEADPQGGFGNLLLDGWWLEFWEIILLAAGDVERNPGPRQMTDKELRKIDARVLGKDALFDVYDTVYDCRPKWRNLCLALRLSPVDLSAVDEKRRGDPKACLEDGLTLWLQGHYDTDTHGPPTWRMLVDAVANSAGGDDHALALEIAEKHKALPTVPSHNDRRFEEMSSSFNSMYRSVVQLLRNVDVDEVKEHLCYLTVPKEFDKLCVPPHVYKRAKTTKDLLGRLCPQYINPGNTFVLEEIIEKFGCRRCKRLVREYIKKFM